MENANKVELGFENNYSILKSQIENLRRVLEENILLYGISDKRVLNISQQLDEVIAFYAKLYN